MDNAEDLVLTKPGDAPQGRQPVVTGTSLNEAKRHVDVLHLSLIGTTAIVILLLIAVSLPVFHFAPVTSLFSFCIIAAMALGGIAYLYYLNFAVHKLVADHANLAEVLVNSLGQGFLSFGINGVCDNVYSQACLDLFDTIPAGKNIMDVLCIPEENRADFKDWLDVLFMPNHALGFQDVVHFLPQLFPHAHRRRITLVYRPIYSKPETLSRVVLIATDETEEYAAHHLAKKRQDYADMICRVFRERNQFLATVTHVREFLDQSALPVTRESLPDLLRMLHTLKAAVKHFHLNELSSTIHALEGTLRSETITNDEDFNHELSAGRLDIEKNLNNVLEQIKELIGHDYERRGNMHEIEESALYNFALVMNVAGTSDEVIDHYLRFIVAVPIRDCFIQFDRELKDLAEIMGKPIKPIRYTGSNPPVLTRRLHGLMFSLTHICRNIIDHGIEPAVTRLGRAKDLAGQIIIHCDLETDAENKQWLYIGIEDDGGGIDPDRVRAKLVATIPDGEWHQQSDHAIIQNIFSLGFSTRNVVSELSGRGVGMEVVKREVLNLGGKIEVFSETGKGTRLDIRVPYALSI